jgi:hypothetical protein
MRLPFWDARNAAANMSTEGSNGETVPARGNGGYSQIFSIAPSILWTVPARPGSGIGANCSSDDLRQPTVGLPDTWFWKDSTCPISANQAFAGKLVHASELADLPKQTSN